MAVEVLALKQRSFPAAITGDPKYSQLSGAMFADETPSTTQVGSETFVKGCGVAEATNF